MANSGRNSPEAHLREIARKEALKAIAESGGSQSWKLAEMPSIQIWGFTDGAGGPDSGWAATDDDWETCRRPPAEYDTILRMMGQFMVTTPGFTMGGWIIRLGHPDYRSSSDPEVQAQTSRETVVPLGTGDSSNGWHVRNSTLLIPKGWSWMLFPDALDSSYLSQANLQYESVYEYR